MQLNTIYSQDYGYLQGCSYIKWYELCVNFDCQLQRNCEVARLALPLGPVLHLPNQFAIDRQGQASILNYSCYCSFRFQGEFIDSFNSHWAFWDLSNFSFCTISISMKLIVVPESMTVESSIFCLESKGTITGVCLPDLAAWAVLK